MLSTACLAILSNSSCSALLKLNSLSLLRWASLFLQKAIAEYPTTRLRSPAGTSPELAYFNNIASLAPNSSAAIMVATIGPPPQASQMRDCKFLKRLK